MLQQIETVAEPVVYGESKWIIQHHETVLQSAHKTDPLVLVLDPVWTQVLPTGPLVCPAIP